MLLIQHSGKIGCEFYETLWDDNYGGIGVTERKGHKSSLSDGADPG